ncbi:hypothetical protein T02_7266 [Trichinella nativa]|uniref:Uncharacterized protein n=1 Tax=Trichinella nativa TaxID=6335 RepID=A0A0V1L536_9BILA|nr:hypothetical protein T02_7266 [Trichinella nativa]
MLSRYYLPTYHHQHHYHCCYDENLLIGEKSTALINNFPFYNEYNVIFVITIAHNSKLLQVAIVELFLQRKLQQFMENSTWHQTKLVTPASPL